MAGDLSAEQSIEQSDYLHRIPGRIEYVSYVCKGKSVIVCHKSILFDAYLRN